MTVKCSSVVEFSILSLYNILQHPHKYPIGYFIRLTAEFLIVKNLIITFLVLSNKTLTPNTHTNFLLTQQFFLWSNVQSSHLARGYISAIRHISRIFCFSAHCLFPSFYLFFKLRYKYLLCYISKVFILKYKKSSKGSSRWWLVEEGCKNCWGRKRRRL